MLWRAKFSPPSRPSLYRSIRAQARLTLDSTESANDSDSGLPHSSALATPRQLVNYLDEYVVGQENAKKVLSVALFNHYNRVRANLLRLREDSVGVALSENQFTDFEKSIAPANLLPHPNRGSRLLKHLPRTASAVPLFEKSNVLVIGPTGSGKTLLVKTLARILDVPFSISDATSFTQAGYVGEDVEMCVHRLLQAAGWDEGRASTGIVYIDEVDKLSKKSSGMEGSRDVGGEGVQQALLRMMEGTTITIHAKPGSGGSNLGPLGGDVRSRSGQTGLRKADNASEVFTIDTSNVLFILSGAFVGLEDVLKKRLAKGSIGFTADLSRRVETPSHSSLPFFTSNVTTVPDPLRSVEPADLVKYGFIPEFVSRLPIITTLSPLTISDLLRILMDVRGSLISQYTALFSCSGVELRFTTLALKEVCRQAAGRGGGARGLRGIMEKLLLDAMYEVPGTTVRYVLVTKSAVEGKHPVSYWSQGEGAIFWSTWAEEESDESAQ